MTPLCTHAVRWTRANHGPALAPLVGQEVTAFHALAHLADLWRCGDRAGRPAALEAMKHTLQAIRPHLRGLARYALAAQDESVAEELWPQIEGGPR